MFYTRVSYSYNFLFYNNFYTCVFNLDTSIVVSAPTGSGKTVIFELAIIRLLMEAEENNDIADIKIIYSK